MSVSSVVNHIKECLPGRSLFDDLNGANELAYKKKQYELIFSEVNPIGSEQTWITDQVGFTIRLFYFVNKQTDFFNSLDDAQSVRLKVANSIKAKKHGITVIEVGAMTSSIDDSVHQRIFEFNVTAQMSFSVL